MASLDANFLKPRIIEIIVALAKYGFVVDTIVGDGASENRSVMRQLGTLTADLLLGEKILSPEVKERRPMDKRIAFHHPTIPTVIIFIEFYTISPNIHKG